ncbi:MAG: hypothetical protein PVH68_21215 [Armatimonadota bacterium]
MATVFAMLAAAVLAALGLLAARASRRQEYVELARRRLLVGAVLCAASFLGACRRIGSADTTPPKPTKLTLFARLGEIWRAMSPHASGAVGDPQAYEALGKRMETALGELKAQAGRGRMKPATAAALEDALRDRYSHIHGMRYSRVTCYEMTILGGDVMGSLDAIEEQVKILNDLAEKGKLPASAVEKARAAIAKELAFQKQAEELWAGEHEWEAEDELHKRYERGDIEATEATTEAAKTLVDFTTKPTGSA